MTWVKTFPDGTTVWGDRIDGASVWFANHNTIQATSLSTGVVSTAAISGHGTPETIAAFDGEMFAPYPTR